MPIVVPLIAFGAAFAALRETLATSDVGAQQPDASSAGSGSPAPASIDWTDAIESARGSIPADFLARWIAEESGGNPCSKGLWGGPWEAGIAQTYFQTQSQVVDGVTFWQLRACCQGDTQAMARDMTDEEKSWQVTGLVSKAKACIGIAQSRVSAIGENWSQEDILCLAKLYHALPVLVTNHLSVASQEGHAASWDDYAAYVSAMSHDDVVAFDAAAGYDATKGAARFYPLDRLFQNAQKTGRG